MFHVNLVVDWQRVYFTCKIFDYVGGFEDVQNGGILRVAPQRTAKQVLTASPVRSLRAVKYCLRFEDELVPGPGPDQRIEEELEKLKLSALLNGPNDAAGAIVTTGPGFFNLITGIAACYYDNVPSVFLCGQVNRGLNKAAEFQTKMYGFQEAPHAEIAEFIADTILRESIS